MKRFFNFFTKLNVLSTQSLIQNKYKYDIDKIKYKYYVIHKNI